MKVQLLFSAVIIITSQSLAKAGFTSGAPCSQRNTVYFTTSKPHFPHDDIKCVDIVGMGRTNITKYLPFLWDADTLYADGMLLRRVPKDIVNAMPKLELIDLSRNRFKRLHRAVFANCTNLKKVLLEKNQIRINPKLPFLQSVSITNLVLSNNEITRLSKLTFAHLPNLTTLFLDGNKLTILKPSTFYPTPRLKYLHIGNNMLTTIPAVHSLPRSVVKYIYKGNPINGTFM